MFADYSASLAATIFTSTITFESNSPECTTPNSFSASVTPISTPTDSNYDGTTMTATMTEFVIDPVSCSITYECTSVTRNGTPDNPVSCGDFTFDFDFASSGSAG